MNWAGARFDEAMPEPAGSMSCSAVGDWPGMYLPLAAVLPAMNALDCDASAEKDEVSPKIQRSRPLGRATLIPASRCRMVPVAVSSLALTGPR